MDGPILMAHSTHITHIASLCALTMSYTSFSAVISSLCLFRLSPEASLVEIHICPLNGALALRVCYCLIFLLGPGLL
jgi:hypothetical protein